MVGSISNLPRGLSVNAMTCKDSKTTKHPGLHCVSRVSSASGLDHLPGASVASWYHDAREGHPKRLPVFSPTAQFPCDSPNVRPIADVCATFHFLPQKLYDCYCCYLYIPHIVLDTFESILATSVRWLDEPLQLTTYTFLVASARTQQSSYEYDCQ